MTKHKKIELWALLAKNIPAYIPPYLYGNNYIVIALFFFVIPSLYLSIRNKKMMKKIATVSIVMMVPIVTIIGYLGYTDGSWYNFGVSGITVFNTYPVDDFLWAFLYGYYILAVYEYFFEREKILRLPKKFLRFELLSLAASVLFCLYLVYRQTPLVIPYFYVYLISIFAIVIPGIIFLRYQKVFVKALYTGLFFLPLSFLCEHVSMEKGAWIFPGNHFIGYVQLLGAHFPFEELLWLICMVPAIVAYYEIWADDEK